MISYYNQTPCFLIVSALRNCNSFSAFELIISYILYTLCFNFHHKSYVNKDSFDTYFTLNLNWPTKKCSRNECHRRCEYEPQALFLSSSFHPRLHVSLCIDEFIIGFKRMISLAQLVEQRTAVREVAGSKPRPDQHSGSLNN